MTVPWERIRQNYAAITHLGAAWKAMLNLVDEINASRYAEGLFAWTSMHDLCIVQTPVTYPYHGPYLRTSPQANGQIEFRYLDTLAADKQWHRTVAGDDAFRRLELFLNQLHWFT